MLHAALIGFLISLSLIVAIGVQNAFVLQCGLRRQHVLTVCTICALSDALLIVLGVLGFGQMTTLLPGLKQAALWGGAAFVGLYGLIRLHAAIRPNTRIGRPATIPSLRKTILLTLGFTWLNPHVYLDTMLLIGAVSTQFETIATKAFFAIGAALASFGFFFSLGFGAQYLSQLFNTPERWRYIDLGIAMIMLGIATQLLTMAVNPPIIQ